MQLSSPIRKKSNRGSLTVESCIALTFFLCLFLFLLFIVKFSCINIVLDHAASETAKQIATCSYPVSLLDDYKNELAGELPSGIVSLPYELVKNKGGEILASQLVGFYLNNSWIDKDKVKIKLAELPQSEDAFNTKSTLNFYDEYGLIPEKDFTADDVVIQLSYEYPIVLPFFNHSTITLVQTAIERAWLNGGSIAYSEPSSDKDDPIVYITRTGTKYHISNCRYLRKSKIPIRLSKAQEQGYRPCKICKPPE